MKVLTPNPNFVIFLQSLLEDIETYLFVFLNKLYLYLENCLPSKQK